MGKNSHSFGQPNANPQYPMSTARAQRDFYRWCETQATLDELKQYVNDETKPAVRRRFISALLGCQNVRDFFDLTNQTHGLPKQTIETVDVPTVIIDLGDD